MAPVISSCPLRVIYIIFADLNLYRDLLPLCSASDLAYAERGGVLCRTGHRRGWKLQVRV